MQSLSISRPLSFISKRIISSQNRMNKDASIRNGGSRLSMMKVQAVSVQFAQDGKTTTLEVPPGENILSVAIDAGMDVPHDCKLGVCMNCAARLVSGTVDQSAGMLSDDVKDKGYVLLCIAIPESEDVSVEVIEEEELLEAVMDN